MSHTANDLTPVTRHEMTEILSPIVRAFMAINRMVEDIESENARMGPSSESRRKAYDEFGEAMAELEKALK